MIQFSPLKKNIINDFREYLAWEYVNFCRCAPQKGIYPDFYNFIKVMIIDDGKWLLQDGNKLLILISLLDRLAEPVPFTSRECSEDLKFYVSKLIKLMSVWPKMIPTLIHCLCHLVERYSLDKNDASYVIEYVESVSGWPESISNVKFELISARENCRCKGHSAKMKILWLIVALARCLPLPHVVKLLQNVESAKNPEQVEWPITETLTDVDLSSFPAANDVEEPLILQQNHGFTLVKKKSASSSTISLTSKDALMITDQSDQENAIRSETVPFQSFPVSNKSLHVHVPTKTAKSMDPHFTSSHRGIVKHSHFFDIPLEQECSLHPAPKKRTLAHKRIRKSRLFTEGRFLGRRTYGLRPSSQKNAERHKRQVLRLKPVIKVPTVQEKKSLENEFENIPIQALLPNSAGTTSPARPLYMKAPDNVTGNQRKPHKLTGHLAELLRNMKSESYSSGKQRVIHVLSERERLRNLSSSTSLTSTIKETRPIDLVCRLLDEQSNEFLQKTENSRTNPSSGSSQISDCLPPATSPPVSVASISLATKVNCLPTPLVSMNTCTDNNSLQIAKVTSVVPAPLEGLERIEAFQNFTNSRTNPDSGTPQIADRLPLAAATLVSATSISMEKKAVQKPSDSLNMFTGNTIPQLSKVPSIPAPSKRLEKKIEVYQISQDLKSKTNSVSLQVPEHLSATARLAAARASHTSVTSKSVEKANNSLLKSLDSINMCIGNSFPQLSKVSSLVPAPVEQSEKRTEAFQNSTYSCTKTNSRSLQTSDRLSSAAKLHVSVSSTSVQKQAKSLSETSYSISRSSNNCSPCLSEGLLSKVLPVDSLTSDCLQDEIEVLPNCTDSAIIRCAINNVSSFKTLDRLPSSAKSLISSDRLQPEIVLSNSTDSVSGHTNSDVSATSALAADNSTCRSLQKSSDSLTLTRNFTRDVTQILDYLPSTVAQDVLATAGVDKKCKSLLNTSDSMSKHRNVFTMKLPVFVETSEWLHHKPADSMTGYTNSDSSKQTSKLVDVSSKLRKKCTKLRLKPLDSLPIGNIFSDKLTSQVPLPSTHVTSGVSAAVEHKNKTLPKSSESLIRHSNGKTSQISDRLASKVFTGTTTLEGLTGKNGVLQKSSDSISGNTHNSSQISGGFCLKNAPMPWFQKETESEKSSNSKTKHVYSDGLTFVKEKRELLRKPLHSVNGCIRNSFSEISDCHSSKVVSVVLLDDSDSDASSSSQVSDCLSSKVIPVVLLDDSDSDPSSSSQVSKLLSSENVLVSTQSVREVTSTRKIASCVPKQKPKDSGNRPTDKWLNAQEMKSRPMLASQLSRRSRKKGNSNTSSQPTVPTNSEIFSDSIQRNLKSSSQGSGNDGPLKKKRNW